MSNAPLSAMPPDASTSWSRMVFPWTPPVAAVIVTTPVELVADTTPRSSANVLIAITLVASAANEDQCTIGGSAAATATNLIAVINANSKLRGIVVASSGGSAVVRLTLQMTGRIGRLITLAKSSTAISALPAANFLASTTEAWKKDAVTFAVGLPQ